MMKIVQLYNDVLDKGVKPVYSNITETTHCVQYSYKRYCKDCGEYIKNVVDEGFVPIEHDFSKGDTCPCGYTQVIPTQNPYIRSFSMSQSSIKVDDKLTFTLDIADAVEGEILTVEFCADDWTETFTLTAPDHIFEHTFSQAGNRSIRFRVCGTSSIWSDYCAAQTLVVEPKTPEETTCDHSADHYNDVLDESVKPVYSNITETTHCVQYSYKRYCTDCGEYIKNVLDEGYPPVEHDFSKGATCDCGYQKVEDTEDKPYVRGFTMSQTSVKVNKTVDFTLDIANFKEGETLTIEFCADNWKETFNLTAPNNVFSRAFNQDGNRSIKFRVVDGEYCPAQTLVVESDHAKIISAPIIAPAVGTYKEKVEGHTFIATVCFNAETEIAELYIGEDGKNYVYSDDPEEQNGVKVFTLKLTLGGNGKGYAGKYKVFVNALKEGKVEDSKSFGTLTIKHDTITNTNPVDSKYKYTAQFNEWYDDYAADKNGTYSPVSIRAKYYKKDKKGNYILDKYGNKVTGTHAFTIIGRNAEKPNQFYIANPGDGRKIFEIILKDVNGELRIAEMVGAKYSIYCSELPVTDIWRYVAK